MAESKDPLDKIKEAQDRYLKSDKGKKAQKKYQKSNQGKETRDKYSKSELGHLTRQRYYHSKKAKEKREERKGLRRTFAAYAKYLETHPTTSLQDFLKEYKERS